MKKLFCGPNWKDGRGEEVLERHLFDLRESVPSNDYYSALLLRMHLYEANARILKFRNPDRPSKPTEGRPNFFTPLMTMGGSGNYTMITPVLTGCYEVLKIRISTFIGFHPSPEALCAPDAGT
jgi:hypothetical protein